MNERAREREIAKLLTMTAALYDKELNEMLLELFYNALDGFELERIKAAFTQHVKRSRFFPKPADIIEIMRGTGDDLESRAIQQANLVWCSIASVGHGATVLFKDPVTNAVVEQCFGGWCQLAGESKERELKWFLKDFEKYFRVYAKAGIERHEPLPGWYDIQNRERGFEIESEGPVMIGFEGESKQIAYAN